MIIAGHSPGENFCRSIPSREGKQCRILFFGLGSIGSRLARLVRDHFHHMAFAFRSTKANATSIDLYEIYNDEEIDIITPDVAFITNPTSMHTETALACARRGIHLFIEKPLSNRMDHMKLLVETVKSNCLIAYVGCNLRFDPIIGHVKKILPVEKVIGARVISSSYLPDWRPEQDYRKSYSARKALGGGVLLDLIHEPDYCHWLFGKIEKIEGTAGNASDLEIETEDFADMTLFHTTGIKASVHLDFFSRHWQRKIEIFGDGFTIKADLIARTLTIVNGNHERIMHFDPLSRDSTYISELHYFFHCLREGEKPMNDVEEHLSVLKPVLEFKKNTGL